MPNPAIVNSLPELLFARAPLRACVYLRPSSVICGHYYWLARKNYFIGSSSSSKNVLPRSYRAFIPKNMTIIVSFNSSVHFQISPPVSQTLQPCLAPIRSYRGV